tara:strand:+ start:181 stop:582 length:402 start_codon:yes stop_codon:yes gene_type:complete
MIIKKILILSITISSFILGQDLLLYSNDNDYLGCLTCNKFNSESICNKFGTYGNKFNSDSIWNKFGTYGNKFNSDSPWNRFSSNGPKIVDRDGNYYGRFSINIRSGYKYSKDLLKLYEYHDGDLEKIRDGLCE